MRWRRSRAAALFAALLLPCPSAFAQVAAPSADLVAGINAYNAGDFASARDHLQAAADRGEAEAMVNLGYMYARGHAVRQDSEFALQLYIRAAKSNDGEAMNAVGYRYEFAKQPDLPKAIDWYCRAVFAGNPRAMNNLGLLFYNGRGVTQDRDEARSLWRQAADRGHLNSAALLAWDQASDQSLSASDRRAGSARLRDVARQGSVVAQQVLRQAGDTEVFPPATEGSLTMKLEPRDPKPGTSKACEALIS
jgi:hypothetical protein